MLNAWQVSTPDGSCIYRAKKVSLAGVITTEQHFQSFAHNRLVTLNAFSCTIGLAAMRMLCEFLKTRACTLKTLCMWGCKLSPDHGYLIGDALKFNKSVTSLDVGSNDLCDNGFACIGNALKENDTLTELIASHNNLSSVQSLLDSLLVNKRLSVLDLGFNYLQDDLAQVFAVNLSLKSVHLTSNNFNARMICDALKRSSSLAIVALDDCSLGSEGVRCIAEASSSLTELDLRKTNLGSASGGALCDALKKNLHLSILDLGHNNLQFEHVHCLSLALIRNQTIKYLNLSNNKPTSMGLQAIAKGLQMNDALKTFIAYALDADIGQFLGLILASNSSLTRIDLSANNAGCDGGKFIGEGLEKNQNLKILDLSECQLQQHDVKAIAEGIKANTALNDLNLDSNHLSVAGACAIREALSVNCTLEQLQIASTSLGSGGCLEVAKMLRVNKGVRSLDVRGNNAELLGLRAILEALETNHTLETLLIGDNNLRADGASVFIGSLKTNNTLTELDMRSSELGGSSQQLADVFAKSQSLTHLELSHCGLEVEYIVSALQNNKKLLEVEGLNDERVDALCARNQVLREYRVESSVITLIAIRRRAHLFPKEILVMIGKYLIKTIEDPRTW